jgi:hypothetical protein
VNYKSAVILSAAEDLITAGPIGLLQIFET